MKNESSSPVAVKPVPDDMRTVTPHLTCAGAAAAIEFYKKAFGATELARLTGDDGLIMHAMVRIGDSMVMLHDEFEAMCALGPKARGGTSVTIHLSVDDVDAWFDRAVAAGAVVKMPLEDMFWGDRYGVVEDPCGHAWSLATHIHDYTPEQIKANFKRACGG